MSLYQITQWCHRMIRDHIKAGEFWIDATAGKGYDTLFLAEHTGTQGRVLAFDIQEEAVRITKKRVVDHGYAEYVEVLQKSHVDMGQYARPGTVDGIVFNFGYLPGGDHNICTKPESSIQAIACGLELLKSGGMMSLCIYSGGDTGYEEKEQILDYLKRLDEKRYVVMVCQYYNRPNDPPVPVCIWKR